MLGLTCGAVLAAIVGFAAATTAQDKYMAVEDVRPGMKGYGLTVMRGVKPERFDVEIISTLHDFRPGQDLFLIKTPHPRLNIARTVAGMSGSPIYINGKMIGAYAYGWFFNVEPIAGVTPIKNMLDDLKRPIPKTLQPGVGRAPLPGTGAGSGSGRENRQQLAHHRWDGKPLDYELHKHAKTVAERSGRVLSAPEGSGLRAASTDVMAGGLSPSAMKLAATLLKPAGMHVLQAGVGGNAKKLNIDVPKNFVDGGVINVQLVRGDISLAGLGTVTHVVGDKLVAFGHPMIGGGVEALPTAIGYVHWILSTQNRSFKIGEPLKPMGTLINDRQASIVVDTSVDAPMFPVSIDIAGALVTKDTKTRWNMEVSHDQFFAPSFVAIGMGSALETTTAERNDMTWRATSSMHLKGYGTLTFDDFGAGNRVPVGASDIARSRLVRAVGAVMNNPWQMGEIEKISMSVEVMHKRDVMFLRGAQVLASELEPGEPARVKLALLPYQGELTYRTIEIPIDKRLAGKEIRIKLMPGYTVDRIVAPPENFKDLVAVLPKMNFPGESIVASYNLPNQATAAFEGKIAHRLPPGAVDILRPTTSSVQPALFGATKQQVIPISGYMIGHDTVRVKVREVVR
jgi:hypothetical protein